MTTLFDCPESPSPKLVWLKKHRLDTFQREGEWRCANGGRTQVGIGATEDEAILDYCARGWEKHWTLETE